MKLINFEPRIYQQTIFNTCINNNTLVVLPTGLGKTNILMMLVAHRLNNYPNSKVVIFAPTKPLLEQHIQTFSKHLDINKEDMVVFSGLIDPEKREEMWKNARIIFSTPQGFQNDVISGKIKLENVSLMAFDESHRAIGDYSYVFLASQYVKTSRFPRIIGLTASPGSDIEKIKEVCSNLFIEKIEVRDENDYDVRNYVQGSKISYEIVELSKEIKEVKNYLDKCLKKRLDNLKEYGYLLNNNPSLKDILSISSEIRKNIVGKDYNSMRAISILSEIIKISHTLELVESQGLRASQIYMDKIFDEASRTKTKSIKNLVQDPDYKAAKYLVDNLLANNFVHPKIEKLKEILAKEILTNKGFKAIVFNNYRDNAFDIVQQLNTINGINAKLFVGQAKKKDTGMSQKEQKLIIEDFSQNKFNVLCATSVAEEGLDIPNVDMVIFYEPIPSAIRSIQRRGRTGRHSYGVIKILVTKGTRDEAYRWASFHKERKMFSAIRNLNKSGFTSKPVQQENTKLDKFIENENHNNYIVFVDSKEKSSKIVKELLDKDLKIIIKNLEIGDYLLSNNCVVEYKTQEDFLESIIDGRMLEQARKLTQYSKPVIVVEGGQDLYSLRNIQKNAIVGMITSLILDFKINVIFTKNPQETALLLYFMTKREQSAEKEGFALHQKKPLSIKEMQEFVVSSFPGIGAILNKPLLRAFGSIKGIVNASEEELKKVENIGNVKARVLKELFDAEYKEK